MIGSALYQDFKRKQDTYVLVKRVFNKWVKVVLQYGTLAVAYYRFGSAMYKFPVPGIRQLLIFLQALIKPLVVRACGIDIAAGTPIGPGFVIHNFSEIVVDAERIGSNLTINQGVYIGPDYTGVGKPVIGDNVYLGCGAKVLGKVHIGDNVVVAANAIVVKDIPPNVMVAGNPCVVISRNTAGDYVSSTPAHAEHKGN